MVGFKVFRNNEPLCLAGVGDSGVLTTTVSWVGGQHREAASIDLSVGGLATPHGRPRTHLRWVDVPLEAGDEIRVQVVDLPEADPPNTRHDDDPAANLEHLKDYIRREAERLGWRIQES